VWVWGFVFCTVRTRALVITLVRGLEIRIAFKKASIRLFVSPFSSLECRFSFPLRRPGPVSISSDSPLTPGYC